jgi:hypothetical protein
METGIGDNCELRMGQVSSDFGVSSGGPAMQLTQNERPTGRIRLSTRWLIILGLILLQGILAVWHSAGLQTVGSNDTAYYYAVAKNIAHGKANPDGVLWNYLGNPPSVERPAGDYWSAGWPFALGLLMRWFGDSPVAAVHICASLSVFLPVTVFLLLQRLTSRWWVAAYGGVLVCLQFKLFQVMVTPDVSLSYDLITTAGFVLLLGVLASRPSLLCFLPSAFVLSLPIWLRGEGFTPLLAASLGILAAPWPWRQRLRYVVGFAALAGICLVPYFLYNIHFFGRISPEARSLTPLMTDFGQFYEFGSDPSLASYAKLGFEGIARLHIEALAFFAKNLWGNIPYLLLLTGTLCPVLRWIACRRAARVESARSGQPDLSNTAVPPRNHQPECGRSDGCRTAAIVTLLSYVILSAAIPLSIAPIASNYDRFLLNTIPVLCVLAVWSIEPLLRFRWTANLGILIVATFLLAYVQWPFHPRKPWTSAWKDRFSSIPVSLAPGNHPEMNPDDIVLSEIPARLCAQLGVNSISAPWDGTVIDESEGPREYDRFFPVFRRKRTVVSVETCRRVIARYHPRFILAADGSILDQFTRRVKDLQLRVVFRGQGQDGVGYTWFAVDEGAPSQ